METSAEDEFLLTASLAHGRFWHLRIFLTAAGSGRVVLNSHRPTQPGRTSSSRSSIKTSVPLILTHETWWVRDWNLAPGSQTERSTWPPSQRTMSYFLAAFGLFAGPETLPPIPLSGGPNSNGLKGVGLNVTTNWASKP